jgi:dihydrofolate reductase
MVGSRLIAEVKQHKLLDLMIIPVIPKIFGGGIPLFTEGCEKSDRNLHSATTFDNGVVMLEHKKSA